MNSIDFTKAFASLTQRQQEVLLKLLAGEKDPEIAEALHITKDTVRKHVENICKNFNLSDREGSGYSHRPELIALFAKYRPELFNGRPKDPTQTAKIIISYHCVPPGDMSAIAQLNLALQNQGYSLFIADSALRAAPNGLQQIYTALNHCDYLLLLLSPLAACSEMVTEEVCLARTLYNSRGEGKPQIFAIALNCPLNLLNHDLRGYLSGMPQYAWATPEDPQGGISAILTWLKSGGRNPVGIYPKTDPSSEPTKALKLTPYAATPNHPPQPVAEPELPRGQVELASAFYIERPGIDARCYEAIGKPGSLIRIKAPRQMGKTSLMARILHHAQQQGYATIPLSFQLADSQIFRNLEHFLQWFSANIALQLGLRDRLADYWDSVYGSKVACKSYFEKHLLPQTQQALVLGLDEVDVVFKHPELAADFFGLLRAWHEEAKNREIWRKLRLVVVHSTEVYVPMDINQSPFNVGLPIELPEFEPDKVLELSQRHGLNWNPLKVQQLMTMVGGHPYLVRLALYHIARRETTLSELLETAPTDAGLYNDHLRRHLWHLEQHPDLATAIKTVVDSDTPVQLESMQGFKLHSLGLVNLQGNHVTPRCNLYRQYFKIRLSS
ncbi:AAA-like domain-containing protein [Lusitaniella coriacea LEGE 07157]|uniref:AAA-like domain-containing protein n=1 Tax=Lusitaniella coriacea LEGE 07157 TaxID=945747 RepID=A0A8J7E1W3_9CYAN|nr:AAA-like domain-containing protein [Lusitaniella coriacea]MBE9118818.1 AAA-like domain-containing protein [Lusitaniella coriacea LEGE 07157]